MNYYTLAFVAGTVSAFFASASPSSDAAVGLPCAANPERTTVRPPAPSAPQIPLVPPLQASVDLERARSASQ